MAISYGDFPIIIPSGRRPRRRRKLRMRLVFFLLSLLLCIVVLYIFMYRTYTVKSNTYHFFCTYSGYSEKESETVMEETLLSGGVGLVYYGEDKIYIIASVYKTAKDAQAVADKNNGTVLSLSLPKYTTKSKAEASEVKKAYEFVEEYAYKFIDMFIALENKSESETVASAAIQVFLSKVKEGEGRFFEKMNERIVQEGSVRFLSKYYATCLILVANECFEQ